MVLRPGNAGSSTAADHVEAIRLALAQLAAGSRRKGTAALHREAGDRFGEGSALNNLGLAVRKAGAVPGGYRYMSGRSRHPPPSRRPEQQAGRPAERDAAGPVSRAIHGSVHQQPGRANNVSVRCPLRPKAHWPGDRLSLRQRDLVKIKLQSASKQSCGALAGRIICDDPTSYYVRKSCIKIAIMRTA